MLEIMRSWDNFHLAETENCQAPLKNHRFKNKVCFINNSGYEWIRRL